MTFVVAMESVVMEMVVMVMVVLSMMVPEVRRLVLSYPLAFQFLSSVLSCCRIIFTSSLFHQSNFTPSLNGIYSTLHSH